MTFEARLALNRLLQCWVLNGGSAFGLSLLDDLFHYDAEKRLPDRLSEYTGSLMHSIHNG